MRISHKLLVFYIFIIISSVAVVLSGTKQTKDYRVSFSSNGFDPAEVNIKKGDRLTFVNNSDTYFWPASDLHPSHLLYPEFDSGKPIKPKETWSFIFTKQGVWNFHDHLNPTRRGVLRVSGGFGSSFFGAAKDLFQHTRVSIVGKESFFDELINKCPKGAKFETGRVCWEKNISEVRKYFGTQAAFDFLVKATLSNPEVLGTCHYYSEYIGFLVYEDFFNGKSPEIYKSAEICGYGFYHALLQEWVSHNKDVSEAKDYCESLDNKPELNFSMGNCIQGIGIGLVFANASNFYGDDQKIISTSLDNCSLAFKDINLKSLCTDGVFSGLAHLYFGDHGISLEVDRHDPFRICRNYKGEMNEKCFSYITEVVFYTLDRDFLLTADFISTTADKKSAISALEKLGTALFSSNYFYGNNTTFSECRKIRPENYYLACFSGYIKRFISVKVREGKVEENKICSKLELSTIEKGFCESNLATFIKNNETGF